MKVCFFDIDGTLVLTGRAGQYAFAETFAEEFGVEELSKEVSFAGCSDRGIAGGLFEAHGVENSQANWERFYEGYVRRLDAQVEQREGEVLPGVVDLINKVEALGDVHLGLLTGNVVAAAEVKLRYYGLWERFAFGGFGDEHPDRNDIAASALDAARVHHGPPSGEERIVVIGDTPNDVRCARAIGAHAVAVATGHTEPIELMVANPDLLIPTLEESDDILSYLAA
ncbi:Phosphoglycolate phosphatase [Planctomycetes bacterium MalM25]|nr:Phosphoglycolate phosphatase [Planctomycetes bacterium MalM25]